MDERPEIYELESIEQLRAIADPLRMRIIDALEYEPRTATQVGELLGLPANKVHYHVRELERVGLLRLVDTREKGGILEKYFLSVSPNLRVPATLLKSLPPNESVAALSEFLHLINQEFMQAFSRHLSAGVTESEPLTLSGTNLWMTDQECRDAVQQIMDLLKPFEERRNLAGEGQRTFVLMAHTTPSAPREPASPDAREVPDVPGMPSVTPSSGTVLPTAEHTATVSVLKRTRSFVAGALYYSRADLERAVREGRALDIALFGYCAIAADVSAELADRAIARFRHRGVLHASPEVRAVLKRKEVEPTMA